MTKAEIILAAVANGASDDELTTLDNTPEDQFGEEKEKEGKKNGSTTNVANVGPRRTATDGDYAYGAGSSGLTNYNFTPTEIPVDGGYLPDVEVNDETDEDDDKGMVDVIKNINIYKGFTIGDFFDDEDEEEVIPGGELGEMDVTPDDFLNDTPTSEPDATRVAPVIVPVIIEKETEKDYYWDDSTNEIKEDSPKTVADLLEENGNTTTIDGESIDIGSTVTDTEEEESYDPADDLWLNQGYDLLKNLAKVTWDLTSPGEVAQLWEQSKKIFSNIDNSLYNAGLSTQIDMAKILENSFGDEKKVSLVIMDQVTGFNGGKVVWITPEGKILNPEDSSISAEEKVLGGWKMIYKDSGIEVGSGYKEWTVKKYEKLIQVESMRAKTDVGFVEGYKEGDASTFFGGGVLAISSLAETMVPALLTYGWSLVPQITAPMYVAYNRERAKMLYPNLSEADGIAKMVENGQEEVLAPNVLGLLAAGLERAGLKGIGKAMLANKKGFSKVITSMILAGNKEGLTEWAQLGTDTLTKELGKGTDYDVALAIAWDTMLSEEGLEMYLMGLVGGFSVSSGGALVNRALRSDQSSIRYVNSKIYEIANLKAKQVKTPKAKEAIQVSIDNIVKELKAFVEKSSKIKKYLTKDEQGKLIERLTAYDLKRREYIVAKLEYHGGVTQYALENGIDIEQALRDGFPELAAEWEIVKDGLNKEADNIQAEIEAIKNTANERLIDAGIKKAKNKGNSVTTFNSAEELETWLTVNEKTLEYPKEKYRGGSGWEIDGNVFINKPRAIEVGAISVAEHETAHVLFGRMLRKDGDLTADGIKFIDDFKATLPNKVIVAITKRLKDANYNMSDPNVQEEYLTHYIDGVMAGEWGTNRKTLKLIGKEVTDLMRGNGYTNVEFTTIQDILDWLTSYVRNKDSGKSTVERNEPKEGGANVTNLSTTDLKPPVDKLGEVDQSTWDKSGANKAFEYIYGKLDGFIWKYVSEETKMVDDFDKENHMQDTYFELLPHIRNFIPAQYNEDGSRKVDENGEVVGNDSLWGWIIPYIKWKGMNAIKKLDFEFTVSIEDENSYVADIEADDFVDVGLAIEEDVTFTILRRLLDIKKGGELHKKIKKGVENIIPFELDKLDTNAFKIAIQKYFKATLFDDLKKIIGTAGSDKYKAWIRTNGEALYKLLPQEVMNNQYSDFIIKGKENISPLEVDQAIKDGILPPGTPRTSGPTLYTKMPYAEVEQLWIDSFLNPVKGRPGSKQNSLLDLMSWFLGFDATMEVINTEEFKDKNGLPQAIIATIGLKIDRGANVRFNTGTETYIINENNFNVQTAMEITRWVENNVGFDEIDPKGLTYILETEFPGDFELERALVVKMSDTGAIINTDSQRFKQTIANDPDISPKVKAQIKKDGALRTNEKALEKILEAAELIAPKLGPSVMKILGYDIFGFINRVLNSAERQQDPDWDGKDKNDKWLTDDDGNYISAPYYDKLEALKLSVKNGEVELPDGLVLSDLRLMNKKFVIFKKIEKILFDGDSKLNGSNIEWKKAQIAKLSVEIDKAGEANLILAKHIARVMIESGVDQATVIHMLQIQTSIVSGFRALTSLDLITVLEGSQEPGTSHPYFQAELDIAKKATNKKGELKYPTEELAIQAAIDATGTKGEHAAANANTMAKVANLHARYLVDKDMDLDKELEAIFAGHGQIHSTKGTFNIVDDIGGNTNAADWLRVMLDPRRKDMFSSEGLTAEEVVVQKTAPTTNFSISDQFNEMLEENEGVGREKVYSEAKGKIEGGSKKNFWNLIFPPSAYDFELFLYRIIGKGEKGKKDLAFFKKHLLDPYDAAYKAMQDDAQRVTDAFKDLVKKLPEVKKNLKKVIPGTKFTYEQALRVSIWTDMGLEVPGLSKTDLKKLLKAIENDPSLIEYKEGLKNVLVDGYPPPTDYWTIEGVAYDMDRSINAISRAKHLEVWKKNKEEIFFKENRAKLEAIYGERYVESLDNMLYRMEFGGNKKKVSRIESNWNTWVNNSVGAIMFFNFRSATLQTISAVNFVDWENNTPYKAAKAFANVNQYRKDFVKILFSNYLKQRRGGGKRTLNEAELTEYLKGKKNPLKAAIAWMLEKGFTPTSAADSLAIAVGGATFYRNQVKYYLEQNYALEAAEAQAWIDFQAKSEKGQQSSRPDLLSEQQAGGLGRLILAFKNTQQQYFRIMTKATLDIKNKRGSLKGNLSKIAYYGVLQNALFASLQTALFAAFSDDEEWDKKTDRMAQTMIDSVLAGLGLTGAVIITVKNGILTYVEQKERGFNADHTRTILQFANLSPTIGSKLRKLYSAIRTEQLNQDAIDEMGLDINSPAVNSIASLISAATNIPVDRAVTITQNLILASTDEANFNQSLALVLGWSSWDIGLEPISRKVQQEAKEKRKKLMEELKLMEKEKENLAKQKELKDKGFCAGAKKDGKDCSLPVVKGTSFCTVHAKVKERKDGKKVQCTHIKKSGKRCGTLTSAKSGLCYYHD